MRAHITANHDSAESAKVRGQGRGKWLVSGALVASCGALALSGVFSANAAPQPHEIAVAPAAVAVAALRAPLGTVVSTGIRNAAGELVFYTVKVDVRDLPQTHFGVVAGYRDAAGNLSADYETNEFKGSDSAPGFHSTSVGLVVSGRAVPAFGYYAGPAAKITASLRGKTVRAHQAMLSTGIIVFWFDTDTSDGTEPSKLAAYDVAGHRLPAGNTTVGRG